MIVIMGQWWIDNITLNPTFMGVFIIFCIVVFVLRVIMVCK